MRTTEELMDTIAEIMADDLYRPLFPKQMAVLLQVEEAEEAVLQEALSRMEDAGMLVYTAKGKCVSPAMMGYVVGTLQKHPRGFGFVQFSDKTGEDIFIAPKALRGAMHKDLVAVKLIKKGRGEHRSEGEIVRILKRNARQLVCTYYEKRQHGVAVPENGKDEDIWIYQEKNGGARHGDRVVVDVEKACVVEILGHKGEQGVDVLAILREQGFSDRFEQAVLQEAAHIPQTLSATDLEGRQDFRDDIVFTIDGEDTKDIDDAVSVKPLENGNFLLGVHIADVSHYVKAGSLLDQSAYERGTSVYPVDRVSPMLPKALSNGICSLNPNVERLTLSVLMEINRQGEVVSHDIVKGVICSREQMTYTDVYKILEEQEEALCQRYAPLVPTLQAMKELTLLLRQKRMERGAIDLDIPEAKIILDEKDKPVEIVRRELTIANRMIEEMMLVCNETVAEHFYWLDMPFLYRVHEEPEEEKMRRFTEFVQILGYGLKGAKQKGVHSRELQNLLVKVKGKKEERVISSAMLRSMQKARYTAEQGLHFGLGTQYYSHFTSPIRRYPDLVIHRIIKEVLDGKMDDVQQNHYRKTLPEIADHCSERERAAEQVERDSVKLKMTEYMVKHLGETFPCIVSGVANFGMFVETEDLIEGMVPMESLYDDYYQYDEKQYALYGKHTGKKYQIGDKVMAQAVRADIKRKSIEFVVDSW